MPFELPPLPYGYSDLEPYIDARTMEIHYTLHHAGYVTKLNKAMESCPTDLKLGLDEMLGDLSLLPDEIRQSVRNNGGGHLNHSLFWRTMTPGGCPLNEEIVDVISRTFGGFESFREEFTNAALSRFGSGWAWLVVNRHGELQVISTPNQDSPIMLGRRPILGLDVWEHAYYLKYQNRRVDYIDAWWNVVNWAEVAANYERVLDYVAQAHFVA